VYLKINGIDPNSNSVMGEILRIQKQHERYDTNDDLDIKH
jgi:hypothetical protein